MHHCRRALAFTALATVGLAGLAIPAQAKDSKGSATSSSVVKSSDTSHAPEVKVTPPSTVPHAATSVHAPGSGAPTTAPTPSTIEASDLARSAQEIAAQIDQVTARLTTSAVDERLKTLLLARSQELKTAVLAGSLPTKAVLTALKHDVGTAIEETETVADSAKEGSVESSTSVKETERPAADPSHGAKGARGRAIASLQGAIDKVPSLRLSDEVKAKIVAGLTHAKETVASHPDAGDAAEVVKDVRQEIEKAKADRFADMAQRMVAVADRVQAAIDRTAATAGNEATVTAASAQLADARAVLASANTPADLRAVWHQLRTIRKSLPQREEAPSPSTTAVTPAGS